MTARPPMLAADMIRELTRHYSTSEWVKQPQHDPTTSRYRTVRRVHTVQHPPLLEQIEQTVTGSTTAGEVFHAAYGSKPAGRIDCLAFLERIHAQTVELEQKLGLPHQPWRTVQPAVVRRLPVPTSDRRRLAPWETVVDRPAVVEYPRLLALSGVLGDRPDSRVKSWWMTARILTQHEGPPYSPDVPCPQETCERWGTIRVRMDPNLAVCVECGHTWSDDDGTFGRLAVWADWAATHLRGPRHLLADDDDHPDVTGYGRHLGYRVVCLECEVERAAMADRNRARAAASKRADTPTRVVSHEVA